MKEPTYGIPLISTDPKRTVGYRFYSNLRDARYPATLFDRALYHRSPSKSRALRSKAAKVRRLWLQLVKGIRGDGVIEPRQMVDFNYCTPAGLLVGKFPQRQCWQNACPFCWCRRYTCSAFDALSAVLQKGSIRLDFVEDRFQLPDGQFRRVDLAVLQDQVDQVARLPRNRGKRRRDELVLTYPAPDVAAGEWVAVRKRIQLSKDPSSLRFSNRIELASHVGGFYAYPLSWFRVMHLPTGKHAMWHPALPLFGPRNGRRWLAGRGALYGVKQE